MFFVFGAAAAWLAFLMPTYADRRARSTPRPAWCRASTASSSSCSASGSPCAPCARARLRRAASDGSRASPRAPATCAWRSPPALGLVFVVGLIGRVPFWLAAAIFVALFTILFEWQPGEPWPARARRIGEAVLHRPRHRRRGDAGVREDLLCAPALRDREARCSTAWASSAAPSSGFMTPAHALQRAVGDLPRHRHRRPAGPHRHHGRRAADHAHLHHAAHRGDHGADLHLRRRHLRRQPQRHPAQHPGHARLRRLHARRLSAGAPGPRRARHGHLHLRLLARHAVRHPVPRAASRRC